MTSRPREQKAAARVADPPRRKDSDALASRADPLVRFVPKDWLDRVFEVGIILKGLDGLLELVGGVLLLLITPADINGIVRALTQHELSEDPRDVIASQLQHTAAGLTGPSLLLGGAYLLVHGVVKVVLVVALLRNKLWAYPWMIAVLLLFICYQAYQIVLTPSAGLIALTVFDIAIVALTVREYQRQRTTRRTPASHPSVPAQTPPANPATVTSPTEQPEMNAEPQPRAAPLSRQLNSAWSPLGRDSGWRQRGRH